MKVAEAKSGTSKREQASPSETRIDVGSESRSVFRSVGSSSRDLGKSLLCLDYASTRIRHFRGESSVTHYSRYCVLWIGLEGFSEKGDRGTVSTRSVVVIEGMRQDC